MAKKKSKKSGKSTIEEQAENKPVEVSEQTEVAETAPAAEETPAADEAQTAEEEQPADAPIEEEKPADAPAEDPAEEEAPAAGPEPAAEEPAEEQPEEPAPAVETPAADPVPETVAEEPAVGEAAPETPAAETPVARKKGFGINFRKYMNSLQHNGLTLLFSAIGTLVIMAGIFVAVFFLVLQSPEQVMVPNVVGESLENALLAMQVKELYPKIQLRYSNTAADKGAVLEQDPPAGTIVKAGRRINLTVSRGIVVDRIGSYVGQKVDDLRVSLQAAFSGMAVQLINVPETLMYRADESEAGTILEQDPLPDTEITSPVTLSLVVSSGPGNETTKVPWIVGMSLNDALLQMNRTKIIFNWTARPVEEGGAAGTVVSQRVPGTNGEASAYSVSECVIALPEGIENDLVYGIFTTDLASFPYPLKIQLDVIPPEGDRYTLVAFKHLGGKLTIPYAVPQFSELVLSVEDKEQLRQIVR